ncbi:MAG TPA: hypothetical protein VI752_00670 [Candidatus Paceibacterota bacterium]
MSDDLNNKKSDKDLTEEVGVSIGVVLAVFIFGVVFVLGMSLIPGAGDATYSEEEIEMNQALFDQGLATTTGSINGANSSLTASTTAF